VIPAILFSRLHLVAAKGQAGEDGTRGVLESGDAIAQCGGPLAGNLRRSRGDGMGTDVFFPVGGADSPGSQETAPADKEKESRSRCMRLKSGIAPDDGAEDCSADWEELVPMPRCF
jgi:hypothetical protein